MKIQSSMIARILLFIIFAIFLASLLSACQQPPQVVPRNYGFSLNTSNGKPFTGFIHWGVNHVELNENINIPVVGYGSQFKLGPYDKFILSVDCPERSFTLSIVEDGRIVGHVDILPGITYELCDGCNNGEGW